MRTDVSRQCRLTPSRRCRDRFRAIKSPKQTRPRSSPRELAQHVSSTEHVSLIHCVTYGVRSLRAVVGWAKARNTPCPRRRCAGHGAPIDFCYSARSEQRAFAHPTTALFRPPTLAERATAGSSPPNRGARRRVARNDAENDVPKSRRLFGQDHATESKSLEHDAIPPNRIVRSCANPKVRTTSGRVRHTMNQEHPPICKNGMYSSSSRGR